MAAISAVASLLGTVIAAAPSETVFWTGAGISADPPTSGPIGNALANRALEHAFASGTAGTIADYYAKLGIRRDRPRLETLLDVVYRVHGQSFLADLLSDLATAKPNALHGFFAAHLSAGGRHITANFDTCIERAAPSGTSVHLLHFHGSFGSGELGATLARIERGFRLPLRDQLERTVRDVAARFVVFVGYSGLDFFDVDPFLRGLPRGSLAHTTVLWVDHAADPPHLVPPNRRQLAWLADAGASVIEIKARTRDVVGEIAARWGFAVVDPGGSPIPWRPRAPVADAEKQRATLELYALMNLHDEVHGRVVRPNTAYEWELLGQALWAKGRYRDAGDAWDAARAGASDTMRRERRGAVFWIRGQFRKARRELLEALADPAASTEERLLIAELLARVLVHMKRFPDSRLVPTNRIRRAALGALEDPDDLAAAGTPLATHLRVRVTSARAALGAADGGDGADAVESFGEYEALGGQLNYRHAALRRRLRTEEVDPAQVRELRGAFEAIGASGDAARAVLLGGIGIFGWRETIAAARALDVSRWHRMRLLGASVAATAIRHVRVRA